MENMQKNWVISETAGFEGTQKSDNKRVKSVSKSRRQRRSSVNIKQTSTSVKRKRRTKTKELTGLSFLIMAAVAVFIIATALLFQQSIISELNGEVRVLQENLTEVKATNDSKVGQLVSSADSANIEVTARSYGMTEATPQQYVYETMMDTQQASVDQNENQSWIRSVLK